MEVAVAVASADVVPDVAALARAGRAELLAYRGGDLFVARECLAEPLEETLLAVLADDAARLFVGTIDGTAVGYAVVTDDRRIAVVREIVVDPEARAIGVGEGLLDAAMAWGRERGCIGIDSFALPGARDTKNFFETAGMKARLLVVHAPLDP
jgi:GNAT superfamily N-acetyltransferase